jgi:hypothetical protein
MPIAILPILIDTVLGIKSIVPVMAKTRLGRSPAFEYIHGIREMADAQCCP